MLNQVKPSFTVPSPRSEAKALVEAFARQDKQRLYPFELQNFKLGIRFQNADPETQRVIVMAMLAWLDQHSLQSFGHQDQNAWQMGWKVREAFLHMLQFNIPFDERDVIAMLNWSASQSSTSAYVYFSGVPQIIKVVRNYLQGNTITEELHSAIQGLTQSIESESRSVEVRRWILQLKELMGETQVSLPLAAGDAWADHALRELYALGSRTKKAWAELLNHCLHATGSTPNEKWLNEADRYIDTIENLDFFIKLSHWFALVDTRPIISANATILRGLIWLCSKSEDAEIARTLATLAISLDTKQTGSGSPAMKLRNACFWALGHMPNREAIAQLIILKSSIRTKSAQKMIANALETAEEIEHSKREKISG
jgi:hypothetical protein